jgi:leucyl aminopeptidase
MATMRVLAELKPKVNVIAAIPCSENMPSGSATKPGDVLSHRGGKTSEVLNTDAEGRLVLADSLAYLAEKKPQVIIDTATLTGACMVALGGTSPAPWATTPH